MQVERWKQAEQTTVFEVTMNIAYDRHRLHATATEYWNARKEHADEIKDDAREHAERCLQSGDRTKQGTFQI